MVLFEVASCHGGRGITSSLIVVVVAAAVLAQVRDPLNLVLGVAIEVFKLLKDEDYFTDSAFGQSNRAHLGLILDESLQCLLAPVDQNRRGNTRNLQLDLVDVSLESFLRVTALMRCI